MPAKAGIQNLLILSDRIGSASRLWRGSPFLQRRIRLWLRAAGGNDFYWIPASTGMTKCGCKNILGRLKGYFPGNNSFNFAVKAGKTSL